MPFKSQIRAIDKRVLDNEALLKGINTFGGFVTYEAVAEAQGLRFSDTKTLLGQL